MKDSTERLGESCTGRVRSFQLLFCKQTIHSPLDSGQLVSSREERISGALKYAWKDGRSRAVAPPRIPPVEESQNVREI